MFEIDKVEFGGFISELRKKKGYTQKELAQRLFISDKAISKWECGISMPDITLLIPLANILDVTVTELLENRRFMDSAEMNPQQVETLVKKALTFSEENPKKAKEKKLKYGMIYVACIGIVVLEMVIFKLLGYTALQLVENNIFVMELLSIIFGGYFWFFIKEKLPTYYDENKISAYSDGVFRMNMAGVHFNNSNWPYIVLTGRLWSVLSAILFPIIYLIGNELFPNIWHIGGAFVGLILFLGGLFIPMYVVAKKYE